MKFDINDMVGKVLALEARIEEIEAKNKEALKPLKDLADQGRNKIQAFMNEIGSRSARTRSGTAILAEKKSYRIEDGDEFRRHVIGTEDWGLLIWSVNRKSAEIFAVEHNNHLPPGVVVTRFDELRINPPEKPKVVKLPLSQPEGGEQAVGFE